MCSYISWGGWALGWRPGNCWCAPQNTSILMPLLPLFLFYLPASSSSPRFASDLEQARPQTTGEEELQLQLALAMSREEAEKVEWACLSWGVRRAPCTLPYL